MIAALGVVAATLAMATASDAAVYDVEVTALVSCGADATVTPTAPGGTLMPIVSVERFALADPTDSRVSVRLDLWDDTVVPSVKVGQLSTGPVGFPNGAYNLPVGSEESFTPGAGVAFGDTSVTTNAALVPGRDYRLDVRIYDFSLGEQHFQDAGTCTAATPAGSVIEAHAPLVILHPSEAHFPIRAEDFIAASSLGFAREDSPDAELEGAISAERLGGRLDDPYLACSNAFTCGREYASDEYTRPGDPPCSWADSGERCKPEPTTLLPREGFYLDITNEDAHEGGSPPFGSFDASVPSYYEYVPGEYIVYWFLWGYSQPLFGSGFPIEHEGDWERVVIDLDPADQPEAIIYFFHHWKLAIPWDDQDCSDGVCVTVSDGHPVVYAAKGGHGSYWGLDCNFDIADVGLPSEGFWKPDRTYDTCGVGAEWRTWEHLAEVSQQPWYGYGGSWGEVGEFKDSIGPPGPHPRIPSIDPAQLDRTWTTSPEDLADQDPGAEVDLTADGYAPDAPVHITLHSTPVVLADVVADDLGAIDVGVTVPDVLPGRHTIVASGPTPTGVDQAVQWPVTVNCVLDFPDVRSDHPFCADIWWLDHKGITGGYPDGSFRPSLDITRQAMAAFLYRYAGEPAFTPPAVPTFSDVPTSHPFFLEVEWLASTGIAGGFPDGTFRPGGQITRQALAAFLYRLGGEPEVTLPVSPTFPDVPESHPFATEIEWLAATEVTGGYPDGTYRPAASVTRQAMAAFLHRYDELPPA